MSPTDLALLATMIERLGPDLTAQAIHQTFRCPEKILRTLDIFDQYEHEPWHDWSGLSTTNVTTIRPNHTTSTTERAA